MAHPRWPGFDTKTGNPIIDNANHRLNRRMWRDLHSRLTVQAAGRKRRKHIKRVEGGTYIQLVAQTMNRLAREAKASS